MEESLVGSQHISPPPEFSSKFSTPPPVAKKPDRLLTKKAKGTPPPAPTRSSSILTSRDFKNSSKESSPLASDESDYSSLDKLNVQRGMSVSVTSAHTNSYRSQTLRNRTSLSPSQESVSSSYNSLSEGRRIHSSFSTSQPQLNKIDHSMLVKPRDRIRSILVGDTTEDDSNLEDDYGSGYNTTLMKLSHGDLHKHAIAVTTPVAPPPVSFPVSIKQATSDGDNADSTSQAGSGNDKVSPIEQPHTSPKERAHTSPYHSKQEEVDGDTTKSTELTQLTMSDPIARAYRQHLMTKMEKQTKKVGYSEVPTTATSYAGHREVSFTRSWGPTTLPSGNPKSKSAVGMTNTLSSQLQALDMPDSAIYPPVDSPADSTQKNILSSGSSSYSNQMQQHKELDYGQDTKGQHKEIVDGAHRSGSPSILESVRFFEKVQTTTQGQSGSGSSYSYGTMPRSRQQHYNHESSSTRYGAAPRGEFRNKAKSIDNLSLSCESSEQEWSPMPKQGFSPGLPRQDVVYPSQGTSSGGNNMGEVWATSSSHTGNLSSSCSSSLGSCTPPQSRRVNFTDFIASGSSAPQGNPESSPGVQTSKVKVNPAQARVYPKSPVPPKKQLQAPVHLNNETSSSVDKTEERKLKPNEFPFPDYVSFHSTQLPKRVKVTRALSSDTNKVSLCVGDALDLHFVRKVKAVEVVDGSNTSFLIPMNSVAKLSIFYDPFGVEKMAGLGFCFKTAGAIMDLRTPPAVVATQQTVQGGDPESSLVKGEILVVHGVRNLFHGRLLKVFSLDTKSVKFLDENCDGSFTTDPACIRMTLSQIYENSILLPQKAILHPTNAIITDTVPDSLSKNAVTLKKFTIHKFVVATPILCKREGSSVESDLLLDVDASVNIDIEEVEMAEEKQKVNLQVAQKLINSSAYKFSVPYLDFPDSFLHAAQCALLANLESKSPYGAKILPPHNISVPADISTHQENSPRSNTKSNPHVNDGTEQWLKSMEQKQALLEAKVSGMCDHLDDACQKVNKIFNYLNKAQTAMNEHKRLLSKSDENRTRSTSLGRSVGSSKHSTSTRPFSQSISEGRTSNSLPKYLSEKSSTLPNLPSTSSSQDENSDEVFVPRGPKPAILPKPKIIPNKVATTAKAKDNANVVQEKVPVKRTSSGPVLNRDSKDGSSSSSKLSTSSSTRPSVDLSEYLLPEPSAKTKTETLLDCQISPTAMKQGEADISIDGDIDIANWCSQIEDELTKLYNESILAIP